MTEYVLIDCNRIQEYVFGSSRLRGICAASLLLDKVEREEIPKIIGKGKIIRAGGGIVLACFDSDGHDTDQAKAFEQKAVALYSKIGASASSVRHTVDGIGSDFYRDVLEQVFFKIQEKKSRPFSVLPVVSTILCVPCEGSGLEFAERVMKGYDDEPERRYGAIEALKISYGRGTFKEEEELERTFPFKVPRDFGGMVSWASAGTKGQIVQLSPEDKTMGIVYADVNGLGSFIKNISGKRDIYEKFCAELTGAVHCAVYEALRWVMEEAKSKANPLSTKHSSQPGLPVKILYIGGDDLAFAIQGRYALDATRELLLHFEKCSKEILERLSIQDSREHLTMSAGVVLAPYNYPIQNFNRLGRALESHAKAYGRQIAGGDVDGNNPPSCVDFCLVKNDAIGDLGHFREQKVVRERDRPEWRLFGGPYSVVEVKNLTDAARRLGTSVFPRNKLKELPKVLYGVDRLRNKEYAHWRGSLTADELRDFESILKSLSCDCRIFPQYEKLNCMATPVVDLVELTDLLCEN